MAKRKSDEQPEQEQAETQDVQEQDAADQADPEPEAEPEDQQSEGSQSTFERKYVITGWDGNVEKLGPATRQTAIQSGFRPTDKEVREVDRHERGGAVIVTVSINVKE